MSLPVYCLLTGHSTGGSRGEGEEEEEEEEEEKEEENEEQEERMTMKKHKPGWGVGGPDSQHCPLYKNLKKTATNDFPQELGGFLQFFSGSLKDF